MNQQTQTIVILDSTQVATPGNIVIRRMAPDKYALEESGLAIRISPDSKLIVDVPASSSFGSEPAMGSMECESYRTRMKSGQWVLFTVKNGLLVAE